jgi:hypothetical protein
MRDNALSVIMAGLKNVILSGASLMRLSKDARAARDSAPVEGRGKITNSKRRRLAAPLLVLFLVGLTGCAASRSPSAKSLHVELCSPILPLPDTTPNDATRKAFEEKMVQVGLLKRVGEVTLSDRRHATVYDVVGSRANSLNYIRRPSASQPAIVQFCYGTIQPTHIINLVKRSDTLYLAEFDYDARLKPWAGSLFAFLHLPPHGVATDLLIAEPCLAQGELASGDLKGIPTKFVEWPPNGKIWYGPRQFPVRFHGPPWQWELQRAAAAEHERRRHAGSC